MIRAAPQRLFGPAFKFGSACDGSEHDRGRRVAAVSQERQHGFNADEGNDSLFRFMRHVVNVPS